jgi:protein-tyrosine phosphatase
MLRLAAESGTSDIVASPHANHQFKFDPDIVAEKVDELRRASGGIVRIHAGCDFHLSFDNIQDALQHPSKYAINQKNYVLVEFSELLIPKTTEEVFYQMQSAGMIPIITHPERNMLLQRQLDRLETWSESGCLLQVTAQSFLGRFGKHAKAFADLLLQKGLVDIVASDAHDTLHRPPSLKEAYDYVSNEFGVVRAEMLFVKNPGATLTGASIEKQMEEPSPVKKWYQFWG